MLPKFVVCASDPVIELDIVETIRQLAPEAEIEICPVSVTLPEMVTDNERQTIVLTELTEFSEDIIGYLGGAPHIRHINFGDAEDVPHAITVTLPFKSDDVIKALGAAGLQRDLKQG